MITMPLLSGNAGEFAVGTYYASLAGTCFSAFVSSASCVIVVSLILVRNKAL